MTGNPPDLEWWWPSPDAFNDLTVTDKDEGWELSAPDNTELGEWLNFWSQSAEHHELFQATFMEALTKHADFVIDDLEKNGQDENLPDRGHTDSEQAENVSTRVQPQHESGSDSESST